MSLDQFLDKPPAQPEEGLDSRSRAVAIVQWSFTLAR